MSESRTRLEGPPPECDPTWRHHPTRHGSIPAQTGPALAESPSGGFVDGFVFLPWHAEQQAPVPCGLGTPARCPPRPKDGTTARACRRGQARSAKNGSSALTRRGQLPARRLEFPVCPYVGPISGNRAAIRAAGEQYTCIRPYRTFLHFPHNDCTSLPPLLRAAALH